MNKTSLALGLAALLFAGTTLFFWSESSTASTRADSLAASNQKRLDSVSSEKDNALAEVDKVRASIVARDKQIADLKTQLEGAKAEAATAATTTTAATTKVAELGKQLEVNTTALNAAKEDSDKAKAEAAELDKKLNDTRAQVEALNADLAKLRESTGSQEFEDKIKSLEAELVAAKSKDSSESENAKAQLLARDATINDLNAQVEDLKAQLAKLEEENKKLKELPRRSQGAVGAPFYRN